MSATSKSSPEPRIPLTRDRVLAEAVVMADEAGIGTLSMRKLAQRLGVEAMSLYYHVSSKDDILDGMIDIVVGEIELPGRGSDWKHAMRRRGISAHAAFARHPWSTALMESRTNPGPAALRYYDAVIGSLRGGGFSVPMAAHAFSVLDAYIYGFGLQEMSLPFEGEEQAHDVAGDLLESFPVDEYPSLYELIVDHALQPGYDYAAEFEWGLALILDALEQRTGSE
jgi:AcrR family transcriptional regulator